MLKRNDLSKQFELVVQQEIKNYQDSLNFVLQSIKELKEEIKQVNDQALENYALLHSEQNDLKIELQNLRDVFMESYKTFHNHINDQYVVNQRNQNQINNLTSEILKKINFDGNFQSKFENLWGEISELKKTTDKNNRVLNDNLDDLLRRFRQGILKAKEEIRQEPSELSLVKTQLEERIVSHSVDVEGIMRELRIYKHDNMVTQKKIENIYTLIERLKKTEVTP
jgi:hypothetical protein